MSLLGSLTTFTNGNVVDADEHNANYSAIRAVINDYAMLSDVDRSVSAVNTYSAQQRFFSGLVGAPGISFNGDTDTGVYRPGANQVSVVAGGAAVAAFAAGATGLTGTLSVTGDVVVGGALGVVGTATIVSNMAVGGSLGVTGAVTAGLYNGQTLTSSANFTGTLAVAGLATLNSLSVTGNATVGGTLGVTGATSMAALSATTGTFSGTLGVTGAATFGAAVTVTGLLTANGGIAGAVVGNASTATTLATSRNFSITGDGTAPAVGFTGAANVALAFTLGTVAHGKGGTGLTATPSNGQLPIGNGAGYALATLTGGTGVSVTNGAGTITLANTGVTSIVAGAGISIDAATGAVTVTNTGLSLAGQGGYRAGTQALASGAWRTVVINTTEWGSGLLNTATGVFTIPTTGKYLVAFRTIHDVASRGARVLYNNTDAVESGIFTNHILLSKVLSLTAGDTIRFQIDATGGDVNIEEGVSVTWGSVTRLPVA